MRFRLGMWAFALWGLAAGVYAEALQVGSTFPVYTLEDAHGQTNVLGAETRAVLIASEKGVSERLTGWLKPRSPGYLEEHRTEYVSDITPMPSIITHLFALPKIRKYPFRLLLARDENFAKTYPHQEGRFALFLLDGQRTITGLHFLEKPEDLEPLLAPLRGH